MNFETQALENRLLQGSILTPPQFRVSRVCASQTSADAQVWISLPAPDPAEIFCYGVLSACTLAAILQLFLVFLR